MSGSHPLHEDLRVDESTPGAETFHATLRGVFIATRALDTLTLDYTGEVDGAEVDGRTVTATHSAQTLTVPLGPWSVVVLGR